MFVDFGRNELLEVLGSSAQVPVLSDGASCRMSIPSLGRPNETSFYNGLGDMADIRY